MAQKTWTPNAKQKLFIETLKKAQAEGKTELSLAEISTLAKENIASGSINCLISKGLVKTTDKEVEVVKKEVRKVYSLVDAGE